MKNKARKNNSTTNVEAVGKVIPGHTRYVITRNGIVYSRSTGRKIAVKDFDNSSGRYNLTIRMRDGTTRRVTRSTEYLVNRAYGKNSYVQNGG